MPLIVFLELDYKLNFFLGTNGLSNKTDFLQFFNLLFLKPSRSKDVQCILDSDSDSNDRAVSNLSDTFTPKCPQESPHKCLDGSESEEDLYAVNYDGKNKQI